MIRTTLLRALAAGLVAAPLALRADDGKTQVVRAVDLSFQAPASWESVKPTARCGRPS